MDFPEEPPPETEGLHFCDVVVFGLDENFHLTLEDLFSSSLRWRGVTATVFF